MAYVILSNLQVVLLFICLIIERFKKVFMHHLAIGGIVVYRTTIIPNTLNKIVNYIELRVVKSWST